MARTIEDAVTMLNVLSGRDLRDWGQQPQGFPPVVARPVDWSGKRIAYWKTPCVGHVDPAVADAIESVLRDLELAGAAVTETRLPSQDDLLETFYRHWYVGAANRLSSIDAARQRHLDPGFVKAARIGKRYTALDRMQAEIHRGQFGAQMDMLLNEYDYVISPTVPIPAFEAGHDVPRGSKLTSWVEWSSFSFPVNLSQQPACSVPCGFTADSLPIGMQIIGARGDDANVLSAALTYQQMYPERFLMRGHKWPEVGGKDH